MKKQLVCLMFALFLWGCQSPESAETREVTADSTVMAELPPPTSGGDFSAAGLQTEEVEAFFSGLQQAVAAGNRQQVASLVAYPLTVETTEEPLMVRDVAAFVQHYDAVMTETVKFAVENAEVATLFANWQGVRIGQGEVWFSGVYEKDEVEEQDYVVKIVAINPTASEVAGESL
jgi:hypothetical protein